MIGRTLTICIFSTLVAAPIPGTLIHALPKIYARIQGKVSVFSPFSDSDRQSYDNLKLRVVGRYGEWRSSYKPGHLHAGIDLKGDFEETVYAIGAGEVLGVYGGFPNRSIMIVHKPDSGTWFYSLYAHVEEIKVRKGDRVDENTALGRLFTEEELIRAGFGTANHVHLEIRKNVRDNGRASTHSMTRADLDRHCMDPLEFFRRAFSQNPPNQYSSYISSSAIVVSVR